MAEPWQCPACSTWMRPDVSEHRCDPSGGVPAKVSAPSSPPASGASITWFPPPGTAITTTTAYPGNWTVSGGTGNVIGLGSAA